MAILLQLAYNRLGVHALAAVIIGQSGLHRLLGSFDLGGKRVRFAWETGRVDGYRSVLAHDIEAGRSIVVLNNTDLSQKDMDLLALDIAGGAFAD